MLYTPKKELFSTITGKYRGLILSAGDLKDAFELVAELCEMEADAIRLKEPYATRTIERLEQAAREIRSLQLDVMDEI